MPLLDDLVAAVEAYPETYVVLEIVDVNITGNVLNTGERASFKVKVTNNGPLHLTNVTVRVSGQNGATVKNSGAAAPFEGSFISGEFDTIDAHGGSQLNVGTYTFEAPAGAQASKTLVKATLEDWNGDPDHIFIGHSDPHRDAPKATFAAAVVAS